MTARLRAPGLLRGGLYFLYGSIFSFALSVAIRAAYDYNRVIDAEAITLVGMIAAPLFFLVGLGAFDYWFYWASGRKTRPEDHSSHGATSWKDYFRVNTDHKVIGIQYICTTFFFFLLGGALAMLMRAELAQPGTQVVDPGVFNGLFSTHAAFMIFLFIIPV